MTLTITCDWESASGVRTPELRATWGRLRIMIGDEIVTLVKELESPSQIRESIDAAAYPLAEWLALNWWDLETASHLPTYGGLNLSGAGEGFPWPSMTLRSDRQQMWVQSLRWNDPNQRVRVLGSVDAMLDADEVRHALSRFIDATVRRLEDCNVTDTLLQEEWASIQSSDTDEREFAIVAASWGFDPYNISDDDASALLSAADTLGDSALFADLSRAVPISGLGSADRWVRDALERTAPTRLLKGLGVPLLEPLADVSGSAPWREGYERARRLRNALDLTPERPVAIEELVGLASATTEPPGNIEALVRIDGDAMGAVVGPGIGPATPRGRFIGARTLARRITAPQTSSSLLTRGSRYTDRFERAFAAEFLAPAEGIEKRLGGDYSDAALAQVAEKLGVSPRVVEHQVENQLAA